jgi:hypothetical protein
MSSLTLTSSARFTDVNSAPSPRCPLPASLPDRFEVGELVQPAPGHCFRPTALNDRGFAIGNLIKPRRFEGASWSAAGLCFPPLPDKPLGEICAENAWPFSAVSSTGLIAGTVGASDDTRRAWASHRGDFGQRFWPNALSFAQGVNAAGTVVGKTLIASDPVLISRGFVLQEAGRPQFFHAPDGGFTDAIAVNDRGTVLLNITGLASRAPRLSSWIWSADAYTPLETPSDCASCGVAMTSDDTVLGFVEPRSGPRYVVLWVNQRLTALNLSTDRKFRPRGLNDQLVAAGSALSPSGERLACRWSFGRGLEFLRDLCPEPPKVTFTDATAINQAGQILCIGRRGAQDSGFLLNPQA